VAFSADGTVIASGSEDKTVRLWDVEMGSCKCTLTGHLQHSDRWDFFVSILSSNFIPLPELLRVLTHLIANAGSSLWHGAQTAEH